MANEASTWQVIFEPNDRIVGIVQYRDFLVMATERRVYQSTVDMSGRVSFHEVTIHEKR